MTYVPPELNNLRPGGVLHLFRDPGADEVAAGHPVVGQSGKLWEQALNSAGMRRQDGNIANTVPTRPSNNDFAKHSGEDVARGQDELADIIRRTQPALVVAYGNEAAFATVPDWPSRDGTIFGATSITERRGYIWRGRVAGVAPKFKVLTTLHPAACLNYRDPSGINAMLLASDLERAKRESSFPELRHREYDTLVLTKAAEARAAAADIRRLRRVGCDIETPTSEELLCIGFGAETQAFIFTKPVFKYGEELIQDPTVEKVFQNGQFDTYFMKTRRGVETASWVDDAMVLWHALWPEIAGKGKKGSKVTRKALHFLISIYEDSPKWHKDYDVDEAGMYELCGIDCCTTLNITNKMLLEAAEQNVMDIYRHEMSMMPVLVAIQERGLRVDEDKRQYAIGELSKRSEKAASRIKEIAEPLLRDRQERIERAHLFFGTRRCPCCNGGKGKRSACWSCAGLDKAPTKKAVKAELRTCRECGGVGRFETFDFNPASPAQQVELFYNVLKLPERYKDGKITADEGALKSLLAEVT